MNMSRDVYQKSIETFSPTSRLLKLAEESSELSAATIRFMSGHDRKSISVIKSEFIEELADVQIMIDQMKCIYGDEIEKKIKEKLIRLEKLIEKEEFKIKRSIKIVY